MQIESIDIRGFGCLVDKRYVFPSDRATLIVADNETGKSTLAAAILACLCGFPNERKSQGKLTQRERYAPWNSDSYAAAIDIRAGGKRLRIERDFARDTFTVRDSDTGKDVSAQYDGDLCSQLLHLPREDFQRIAFIRGKEAPSFERTETLRGRLSALAEGSADGTGAELAISMLDAARYTLESALTVSNAVKRIREQSEAKRARLEALERGLEAVGEDADRLEQSVALVEKLRAVMDALDGDYQAAVEAEQRSNEQSVQRLEAQTSLKDAELRLAGIDKRRAAAKSVWAALAAGGGVLGLIGFTAFVAGWATAAPSIAAALIGIGLAAAGAVQITRSALLDAEERLSLQGEIKHLQSLVVEEPPTPAGARSFLIDGQRRDRRRELDEANDTARRLQSNVGAAVDAYRREVPVLREDLRKLDDELAKAERFGAAIATAREVLAEVAEESHRRWAVALNDTASTILSELSRGYGDLRFDDALDFTIVHKDDCRTLEQVDIDARLSTGAKDQVYLAVRLAFCQELSDDGEPIPVLLDDPFLAADDSRFAIGMGYLAETLAQGRQVLVLSCSEHRHELLTKQPWFGTRIVRCSLEGRNAH